jgi:hypothetical protein
MKNITTKLGFITPLVVAGLIAFSGCSKGKTPVLYANEGVSNVGVVNYIDFEKVPDQEKVDSAKINVNVSTQVATGGKFFSEGGKINNGSNGRGVVIKMQPLDTALAERIIYAKNDGMGVPPSILLNYIHQGDTIALYGQNYGNGIIDEFDPESIKKVNR